MADVPVSRIPELPEELAKRIQLVRRDMGTLLFHFTRATEGHSAQSVLKTILEEQALKGNGKWTEGHECVCFTEAPIAEFASIFSLVEIAATREQRPRYEPYGVAVAKEWLFGLGGRPVIYEHPDAFKSYPEAQRFRLAPLSFKEGLDFTWEREWRMPGASVRLDPRHTLVVVPTAEAAFDLMDRSVDPPDGEGTTGSEDIAQNYRFPKWMAVSLDLFGLRVDAG